MKLLSVLIVLLSSVSYAQTNYTDAPRQAVSYNKNEGIKLGLIKSFFKGELEITATDGFDSFSASTSDDVDQDIGLVVGYQMIRPYDVGFNTQLSYNMLEEDVNSIRLEGNIAYGINDMMHVLGGLNLNKFTGDDGVDEYDAEVGFQLGMGANIQMFNVSLMYYQIKNSVSESDSGITVDADITLKGLELGVGITF